MSRRISKALREQVRQKYGGRCAYCGDELSDRFHVDHFEPVQRHWRAEDKERMNRIENLMPACAPCNLFKSVFYVEQFRREIASQVERARRYQVNFRFAEKFGLIQVTGKPVRFHFESTPRGAGER